MARVLLMRIPAGHMPKMPAHRHRVGFPYTESERTRGLLNEYKYVQVLFLFSLSCPPPPCRRPSLTNLNGSSSESLVRMSRPTYRYSCVSRSA
jgi:hypothetical protein